MQAPCEEAAATVESAGVGGEEKKEVMGTDLGRGRRSVWLAGVTLSGDIPALEWTCPPGPSPCLGPRPPSPENLDTVYLHL